MVFMASYVDQFSAWFKGFEWRPLSKAATFHLAFWGVLSGLIFFIFHLHGNTQEVEGCGFSLFRWMFSRWKGDSEYCVYIPFVSAAIVWLKRKEMAGATRRIDWRGLAVAVAALGLHWAGAVAQQPRLSVVALIVLVWALPFFFFGWGVAKRLLFPCSYLAFCIPLGFLDSATAPLRLFATWASVGILNGFGMDLIRVGSGITSTAANAFQFDVAPECSGLRSLLAMTALMAVYAWWSQKTITKKWILFLFCIPVAVVANVFRIMLVVVVAALFGQELALGLWHDYSGYPIFLIGILLMLSLDQLLNMDYCSKWNKWKKRIFEPIS